MKKGRRPPDVEDEEAAANTNSQPERLYTLIQRSGGFDNDTVVVKVVDYPFIVACEYGDLNRIKQYLVKHNHHPHNNNIITTCIQCKINTATTSTYYTYFSG